MANPSRDDLNKALSFFEMETFPPDGNLASTAAYAIRRALTLIDMLPVDLIRKIRDQFGDDKCWMDWIELFKMLPEGYDQPKQDIKVQLKNCEQYLACLAHGTEYMPPPRWVKGLPDKPGLWVLTTVNGYRFTINYNGGKLTGIKDAKIYCSFGPFPKEPECLLKNDSDS